MSTAYTQSVNAANQSFSPFKTFQQSLKRNAASVGTPEWLYAQLSGQKSAYEPSSKPRMGLFKKVLIALAGLWVFKKLLARVRAAAAQKTENLDLFA